MHTFIHTRSIYTQHFGVQYTCIYWQCQYILYLCMLTVSIHSSLCDNENPTTHSISVGLDAQCWRQNQCHHHLNRPHLARLCVGPCQAVSYVFLNIVSPQAMVANSTWLIALAWIRIVAVSLRAFLMKPSIVWDGHTKHWTHGNWACMIGKAPLQAPSIVQEKTFSWPSVRISATMEFAMKGMFLSCPDASKARRTFMNPSDAASILRIGLLLVLCHPSPMKQAPISL